VSSFFSQVELQEASPRLGKVVGAADQGEGGEEEEGEGGGGPSTAAPRPAGGGTRVIQAGGNKRGAAAGSSDLPTNGVLPPSEPRPVASHASPSPRHYQSHVAAVLMAVYQLISPVHQLISRMLSLQQLISSLLSLQHLISRLQPVRQLTTSTFPGR